MSGEVCKLCLMFREAVKSIKGSTSTRGRDGGVKWDVNKHPYRLYVLRASQSIEDRVPGTVEYSKIRC
jgi:hypothetical protein